MGMTDLERLLRQRARTWGRLAEQHVGNARLFAVQLRLRRTLNAEIPSAALDEQPLLDLIERAGEGAKQCAIEAVRAARQSEGFASLVTE